jgi:putative acetyltransferase
MKKHKENVIELVDVLSKEQLEHIRRLFQEYAEELQFDLYFQNFKKELVSLPGDYAMYNNEVCGCVALRRIQDDICEMKRMYVRPKYRGRGIGRLMAQKIIREATAMGYKRMRLDTIDTMKTAISLYKSLGFNKIEPYRYNPIKGASYMELIL